MNSAEEAGGPKKPLKIFFELCGMEKNRPKPDFC
jgi:hypothetical protein